MTQPRSHHKQRGQVAVEKDEEERIGLSNDFHRINLKGVLEGKYNSKLGSDVVGFQHKVCF